MDRQCRDICTFQAINRTVNRSANKRLLFEKKKKKQYLHIDYIFIIRLLGFVLPLDEDGMPIPNSYMASLADCIKYYFDEKDPANLLQTVIAQSLTKDAPFFVLLIYGTDNKYNYSALNARWNKITNVLENNGITVAGICADDNSRALKATLLRSCIKRGIKHKRKSPDCSFSEDFPEFLGELRQKNLSTQDTPHIGAKMRNKNFKKSQYFPMGCYIVCSGYIKLLIYTVSKHHHGLPDNLVENKDKMNFKSVLQLCNLRVIDSSKKLSLAAKGHKNF